MRRFIGAAALGLVGVYALLASSSLLIGGDKKTSDKKEPERKVSKSSQAIRAVHAAYEMASVGKEKNVPEALIAAARILGTTGREKSELEKGSEVGKLLDFNEEKEAHELLNEALKMAKSSDTESAIKTLVEDAKKDLSGFKRGGVYGGRTYRGYFAGDPSDRADSFKVRARGGEHLDISLNGYGGSGLDLDLELIDDESNAVVRRDSSVGPNAYIGFPVPYGGARDYRIRVINYRSNIRCDGYTLSHN